MPNNRQSFQSLSEKITLVENIIMARIAYNLNMKTLVNNLTVAELTSFYYRELIGFPEDVAAKCASSNSSTGRHITHEEYIGGLQGDIILYEYLLSLIQQGKTAADPTLAMEIVKEIARAQVAYQANDLQDIISQNIACLERNHLVAQGNTKKEREKRSRSISEASKKIATSLHNLMEHDHLLEIETILSNLSQRQKYFESNFSIEISNNDQRYLATDKTSRTGKTEHVFVWIAKKICGLKREVNNNKDLVAQNSIAAISELLDRAMRASHALQEQIQSVEIVEFRDLQVASYKLLADIYHATILVADVMAEAATNRAALAQLQKFEAKARTALELNVPAIMRALDKASELASKVAHLKCEEAIQREMLTCKYESELTPQLHTFRMRSRQILREAKAAASNPRHVAVRDAASSAATSTAAARSTAMLTIDPSIVKSFSAKNRETLISICKVAVGGEKNIAISYPEIENLFLGLGAQVISKNGSHRKFRFSALDIDTLAYTQNVNISAVKPHGASAKANDGQLPGFAIQCCHEGLNKLGVYATIGIEATNRPKP